MPTAEATIWRTDEEAGYTPGADATRIADGPMVPDELEARLSVRTADELPASHPNIEASDITAEGLIKVCRYFAEMAERNPELAKTQANETVEWVHNTESLRQKGMDDAAIKKQQWASMRARHQEKVRATTESEQDPSSLETVTVTRQDRTEHMHLDAVEVQPAEAVSTQTESAVAEVPHSQRQAQEAVVPGTVEAEEEQHPLRYIEIDRLTDHDYEQWMREATKAIVADEAAATPVWPQPGVSRQPSRPELITITRMPEPSEQQQAAGHSQDEYRFTEIADGILPGEGTVFEAERLTAEQTPPERSDEQVRLKPPLFDIFLDDELAEPTGDGPMGETELDSRQPELMDWADALYLYEEPTQIYEDFRESLQLLVDLPNKEPGLAAEDELTLGADDELINPNEVQGAQPLPVIVATVAEQLSELEDEQKEAIALVMVDIIKAECSIEALAAEESEPETIEVMQAELEEAVIELFEQLDIEYDDEDVETFITILHRPDFQPPQPETDINAADLEHDGTHEAKINLSQQIGSIADTKNKIQHLLGRLILFYHLLAKHPIYRGLEPN